MVSEKFKHFVTILRQNYITDKCDVEKNLHGVYDQNSVIDCELLTYVWIISYTMHYMKNKCT